MAAIAGRESDRAAPRRPGSDRHAGDVRDRREGDRQPDPGYLRGVRFVRDAAARRLRRDASRTGAGAGLAGRGRARFSCRWQPSCRRWAWLAAAAMVVVGFFVLFSGVVSSVLAGATTSLLLGFILPVTLPGPVSSIPDRLEGWALAGGASVLAITVLWPAPVRDPLRARTAEACRLLARRLRTEVAHVTDAARRSRRSDSTRSCGESDAAMSSAAYRVLRHALPAHRPDDLGANGRATRRRTRLAQPDRERSPSRPHDVGRPHRSAR